MSFFDGCWWVHQKKSWTKSIWAVCSKFSRFSSSMPRVLHSLVNSILAFNTIFAFGFFGGLCLDLAAQYSELQLLGRSKLLLDSRRSRQNICTDWELSSAFHMLFSSHPLSLCLFWFFSSLKTFPSPFLGITTVFASQRPFSSSGVLFLLFHYSLGNFMQFLKY